MEITPINFPDSYEIDGHKIVYSNFLEVAQGGPEVGTIYIDGKPIGKKEYFGGPPVFHQGKMFVPRLNKTLLGRHFKICLIDLVTLSIKEIGPRQELVLLTKVDDTTLYFYQDLPNTRMNTLRWN